MRKLRVTHPRGVFFGASHHPVGSIVDVADDHRARQLVELGHFEFVALVAGMDPVDAHSRPVEKATARRAPERAARA